MRRLKFIHQLSNDDEAASFNYELNPLALTRNGPSLLEGQTEPVSRLNRKLPDDTGKGVGALQITKSTTPKSHS